MKSCKVFKKIFSLVLAAVMIVTFIPAIPASADNTVKPDKWYDYTYKQSGVKNRITYGNFYNKDKPAQSFISSDSMLKPLTQVYGRTTVKETNNFKVNSTAAGSYIIEFTSSIEPDSWFDCNMSVVYLSKSNKNEIHYTKTFCLTKAANEFLKRDTDDQFRIGAREMISINLPDCEKIIGLYIENADTWGYDDDAWAFYEMNVYKTTSKIGDHINSGKMSTRNYSGELVAKVPKSDCKENHIGQDDKYQEWLYTLENDFTNAEIFNEDNNHSTKYLLSIVMGEQGISTSNGKLNVKVMYKDLYGDGYNFSLGNDYDNTRRTYYSDSAPYAIKNDRNKYNLINANLLINTVESTKNKTVFDFADANFSALQYDKATVNNVNAAAAMLTGNFIEGHNYDGKLYAEPYSSLDMVFYAPNGISKITGIEITNNTGNTVSVQGMTVYCLDSFSGDLYFNGGISQQPVTDWSGYAIATTKTPLALNNDSSYTLSDIENLPTKKEERIYVDNKGDEIGFGVCLADIDGAGLDVWNKVYMSFCSLLETYGGSAIESLHSESSAYLSYISSSEAYGYLLLSLEQEGVGLANWAALHQEVFSEFLFLTLTYKDTSGYTRKVSVPFTTALVLQANSDTDFFSSYGNANTLTGFANQGQELALRVRLSHFEELVSVQLDFADKDKAKTISPNLSTFSYEGFNFQLYRNYNSDLFSIENGKYADEEIAVRAINYYGKVDETSLYTKLDEDTGYFEAVIGDTAEKKVFIPELQPGYEREGSTLVRNGYINVLYSDMSDGTFDYKEDIKNAYLVKFTYQDDNADSTFNKFGTSAEINLSLEYTNEAGEKRESTIVSMRDSVHEMLGEKPAYTLDDEEIDHTYYFETGLLESDKTGYVVLWLDEKAASIDAANIELIPDIDTIFGDIWQINSIEVSSIEDMSQIYNDYAASWPSSFGRYYRNYESRKMAYANSPVMFIKNNGYKETIRFVTINEDGSENVPDSEESDKTDNYLTTIPSSMSFEQVSQYLGLSIPKCEYIVNVNVADLPDAGSNNHFYFQLLFKNGTSSVVLANQQLASDGFRMGATETFNIKTTQNYGELVGVRIICDSSSSQANTFDKLNIASIDVLMTNSGIGKRWTVDNVGWVDINYQEEGITDTYNTSEVLKLTNAQISKDYPVTSSGNVIDLLFTFWFKNPRASKADIFARLIYVDTNNEKVALEFNLTDKLMEYVDGKSSTVYPYLNKMVLSLSDVSSIKRLELFSTNSEYFSMEVNNVIIEQAIGLGDLYAVSHNKYERHIDNLIPITNAQNTTTIQGNTLRSISFANNNITINTSGNEWGSAISRYPAVNDYSVNMYIFGGTIAGVDYPFTESTPQLNATINHKTLFNSNSTKATKTAVSKFGHCNGKPCLYIKDFPVSNLASIESIDVTSTLLEGTQPVLGYALVEIVNNGVIVDTVYIDFYNSYILGSVTGHAVSDKNVYNDYTQKVYLMLNPGEDDVLTAETSDIAIALRYTSELDPASAKHVYQSPYVFFTDVKISDLSKHLVLEIPFDIDGADEIVGISIQTNGPVAEFKNAVVYNCYNNAEQTVKDVAHFTNSFTASTQLNNQTKNRSISTVSPVTIDISTAAETEFAGAGYSGKVAMTVKYTDSKGNPLSVTVNDIAPYITGSTASGGVAQIKLLANDVSKIESVMFDVKDNDPWYISTVTACVMQKDGSTETSTGLANGWAEPNAPITVSFVTTGTQPEVTVEEITGFTLAASSQNSGKIVSVANGNNQYLDVFPGDTVSIIANVSGTENIDKTVVWDNAADFGEYSTDGNTVTVTVPSNATIGHTGAFTATSAADANFKATVQLRVVEDTTPVVTSDKYTMTINVNGEAVKANVNGEAVEAVENKTISADSSFSIDLLANQEVTVEAVTVEPTDKVTWTLGDVSADYFEKTAAGYIITTNGNNVSFKTNAFTKPLDADAKIVLTGTYTSGSTTHTVTLTFNLRVILYMEVKHENSGTVKNTTVLSSNNIGEKEYVLEIADGDELTITSLMPGGKMYLVGQETTTENEISSTKKVETEIDSTYIVKAYEWLNSNGDTLSIVYKNANGKKVAGYSVAFKLPATP